METSVLEVKDDGLKVHFMDGSSWSINLGDITKTILWYSTQRIVVEHSEDDVYSYTLTNIDTVDPDKVKASRIN